jgi:hypothetical protein
MPHLTDRLSQLLVPIRAAAEELTRRTPPLDPAQAWIALTQARERLELAQLDDGDWREVRSELTPIGQARLQLNQAEQRFIRALAQADQPQCLRGARLWGQTLLADPADMYRLQPLLSWTGFADGQHYQPREIIIVADQYHYFTKRNRLLTTTACGQRFRTRHHTLVSGRPKLCQRCSAQDRPGGPELLESQARSLVVAEEAERLAQIIVANFTQVPPAVSEYRLPLLISEARHRVLYRLIWSEWQVSGDTALALLLGADQAERLRQRLPDNIYRLVDAIGEDDWLDCCLLFAGGTGEAYPQIITLERQWPALVAERFRDRLGLVPQAQRSPIVAFAQSRLERGRRINHQGKPVIIDS